MNTPHEFAHELELIYGADLKSVVIYGSSADDGETKKSPVSIVTNYERYDANTDENLPTTSTHATASSSSLSDKSIRHKYSNSKKSVIRVNLAKESLDYSESEEENKAEANSRHLPS